MGQDHGRSQRAGGDDTLLGALSRDVWPLLSDRRPITKAEREEILGYEPDFGAAV